MKMFSALKAEKNLTRLFEERDCRTAAATKALSNLTGLGQAAVPVIVRSLSTTDKKQTIALVNVLADLVDERSFPLFVEGLKRHAVGMIRQGFPAMHDQLIVQVDVDGMCRQ